MRKGFDRLTVNKRTEVYPTQSQHRENHGAGPDRRGQVLHRRLEGVALDAEEDQVERPREILGRRQFGLQDQVAHGGFSPADPAREAPLPVWDGRGR